MGTPSRVKEGIQEMKIVMELMTTVRLLTDSNTPAYMRMVYKIRYIMLAIVNIM